MESFCPVSMIRDGYKARRDVWKTEVELHGEAVQAHNKKVVGSIPDEIVLCGVYM